VILDTGLWILDKIKNDFWFIPDEDGIFDQHRATSNQHLSASSGKFDKCTQLVGLRHNFTNILYTPNALLHLPARSVFVNQQF